MFLTSPYIDQAITRFEGVLSVTAMLRQLTDSFRFADNTGVDQLDQHCTVRKIHPFGWQGGTATMVNMKPPNRFEVRASTGVVRVSRGVLHLEPVP
jgi:hypothetical protein